MRTVLIVLLACLPAPAAIAHRQKDPDEERAVAEIKKLGGVVTVDPKRNRVVEVDFASPGLTDEGLKHLKALKGLKALDLGRSQVTDAGLQYLGKELKGLRELYLSSPRITDEGLAHLRGLPELTHLHLSGMQVTDVGLKHLQECKGLAVLTLKGTKVADQGVRSLQKALPKLEVRRIDPPPSHEDLSRSINERVPLSHDVTRLSVIGVSRQAGTERHNSAAAASLSVCGSPELTEPGAVSFANARHCPRSGAPSRSRSLL